MYGDWATMECNDSYFIPLISIKLVLPIFEGHLLNEGFAKFSLGTECCCGQRRVFIFTQESQYLYLDVLICLLWETLPWKSEPSLVN